MFYSITLIITFVLVGVGAYLLGRTDEMRRQGNISFDDWRNLIKGAEERRNNRDDIVYPHCDDTMIDHVFCLKCAVRTLDEMRYTIPRHVWSKGFKAYDWLGHFEKVYTKRHESHLMEKPH